jgi:hypothetical protein
LLISQGTFQEQVCKQEFHVILVLYTSPATTSAFLLLAMLALGNNAELQHAIFGIRNTFLQLGQEGTNGWILSQ